MHLEFDTPTILYFIILGIDKYFESILVLPSTEKPDRNHRMTCPPTTFMHLWPGSVFDISFINQILKITMDTSKCEKWWLSSVKIYLRINPIEAQRVFSLNI